MVQFIFLNILRTVHFVFIENLGMVRFTIALVHSGDFGIKNDVTYLPLYMTSLL